MKLFRIDDPREVSADDFPKDGTQRERLAFLLRYAILAPSVRNTQPWKFAITGDRIGLFADRTRWLKAADPDRRDLHLSLGCALENLLLAAVHFGYVPKIDYCPRPDLPDALERACKGSGITLFTSSDPAIKHAVAGLLRRACDWQLADAAYLEELAYWTGEGDYGLAWPSLHFGPLGPMQVEKAMAGEVDLMARAPLFGVLLTKGADTATVVRAGRALERIWFASSKRGASLRPASALCAVPAVRDELERIVGAGDLHALMAFRLGFSGEEKAHTERRPVDEVVSAIPLP